MTTEGLYKQERKNHALHIFSAATQFVDDIMNEMSSSWKFYGLVLS